MRENGLLFCKVLLQSDKEAYVQNKTRSITTDLLILTEINLLDIFVISWLYLMIPHKKSDKETSIFNK
jgi:hypothetical protein